MIGLPCKTIKAPPNGRMTCSGLVTNETCLFSCNDGYDLKGSGRRTCLNSGEWDGDETFCKGEQRRPHHLSFGYDLSVSLIMILANFRLNVLIKRSDIWRVNKSFIPDWAFVKQCHKTIFFHLTLVFISRAQ